MLSVKQGGLKYHFFLTFFISYNNNNYVKYTSLNNILQHFLDEAIYFSLHVNVLGKGMNPSVHSPALVKQ